MKKEITVTGAQNDNGVPAVQWKAWSEDQRKLFNDVFKRISRHPEAIIPSTLTVNKTQHKFIARAAAIVAANALKG